MNMSELCEPLKIDENSDEMFSLLVAQRHFFDELHISSDLESVDTMDFELVTELILARTSREYLNLTLSELDGNVNLVGWN